MARRRRWAPCFVSVALCLGAEGFWPGLLRARTVTTQFIPLNTLPPLCAVKVDIKEAFEFTKRVARDVPAFSPAVRAGLAALGSGEKERARNLKVAADSLHHYSVGLDTALQGDKLVMRDCHAVFNRTAEFARRDSQNYALLVYGPPGVGKTSIIRAALNGVAGVVSLVYSGDRKDFEKFLEDRVLDGVGLSGGLPITECCGYRLRAMLSFYKQCFKCRPLFVIDIHPKVQPEALPDVLLAVKQLGFEEKRATFILVLSATTSAYGLPININGLRVEGYHAPDFSSEEAQEYARRNLRAFPDLAHFVVEQVGTRAIHLVEACMECDDAITRKECEERVRRYRAVMIRDADRKLRGFLGTAKRKGALFSKDASFAFFTDLFDGKDELIDIDAQEAFGFETPEALLAVLAEYKVFAVDPYTGAVSMQSHFMRLALEEYVGR